MASMPGMPGPAGGELRQRVLAVEMLALRRGVEDLPYGND